MIVPFNDYVRIYRVIRSVLESYKGTDINKACIAFAVGGASILREHYRIPATIFAGAAAYCVSDERPELDVLTHGKVDAAGNLRADPAAFHAWIMADDDVIDFQAPLFPEIFKKERGEDVKSAPMMFQKPRSEMRHIQEFKKAGDFCYDSYDPQTTEALLYESFTNPDYKVAWETMVGWYVRPPKKIRRSVEQGSTKYGRIVIPLTDAPVDGSR